MDIDTFLAKLHGNPPTTKAEWLDYVREALVFKDNPHRDQVALALTSCVQSGFKPNDSLDIQPVMDALYELELPDEHATPRYADDFNDDEEAAFSKFAKVYVSYKWRKLAELLSAM